MNVIETVRELLQSFPKIAEACGSVHVDFADPEPTSYGLTSIGDTLVSENILGDQTWRHSFLLYATFHSANEFDRLVNSGLLQELTLWLSSQGGQEITQDIGSDTRSGEITRISAGNAMLYEIPQENALDGVQYQMSITADYKIYI